MPNAICYYQREQHVLSYFHNRKAPKVAPNHDKRVLSTYADILDHVMLAKALIDCLV